MCYVAVGYAIYGMTVLYLVFGSILHVAIHQAGVSFCCYPFLAAIQLLVMKAVPNLALDMF